MGPKEENSQAVRDEVTPSVVGRPCPTHMALPLKIYLNAAPPPCVLAARGLAKRGTQTVQGPLAMTVDVVQPPKGHLASCTLSLRELISSSFHVTLVAMPWQEH